MQSIRTRYLGPTNTRGARIKATSASGQSATVGRDYEKDVQADERRAAAALGDLPDVVDALIDLFGTRLGGHVAV